LLQLLAEDRFPAIWMPSTEYRDLRCLLLHRHQWVRMWTRVQNALHAIVLAQGVRRGHTLWNRDGQALLAHCRCRRTRRIAAASSKRCISTGRPTSIDSTTESSTWRMSVLERRCS
jgi:hypothetical protein